MKNASGNEWDRIWIGANIATMVAGAEPYGNINNGALAVKGDRIAWIGSAADGAARAAAQGVPVEDAAGSVDDSGTDRLSHALGVRRQSG